MTQLSDDLLRGAEGAAKFLGISQRNVYHMVEAGQLPVIRMGRAMFFRKSELERAFTADNIQPRAFAAEEEAPEPPKTGRSITAALSELLVKFNISPVDTQPALGRMRNFIRLGLLPLEGGWSKGRAKELSPYMARRVAWAFKLNCYGVAPAEICAILADYTDVDLSRTEITFRLPNRFAEDDGLLICVTLASDSDAPSAKPALAPLCRATNCHNRRPCDHESCQYDEYWTARDSDASLAEGANK